MSYTPEQPQQFKNPQIILNSGRILLNAKDDSIFIFAKKAIGLSSAGTINFDSDDYFIVNAPKIYLGLNAHKEEEPILLGTKTTDLLKTLLTSLSALSNTLSKIQGVEVGVPYADVNLTAESLTQTIQNLINQLPDIKSQQNFTI